MNKSLLVVLCSSLWVIPTAGAFTRAEGPCHQDVEKYCNNVTPGEGAVLRCLQQQDPDQLSAGCRLKGETAMKKAAVFREACGAEMERLCSQVLQGEGKRVRCLLEHQSEVKTPACQEKLAQVKVNVAAHPKKVRAHKRAAK